jgi:hypothetical protein
MTATEKQALLDQLQQSHGRMSKLLSGLTESQWNFREAPGRWTIAECIEHIAIVEKRVLSRVEQKLTEPPEPEKKPLAAGKDEIIPAMIPKRTTRVVAPEPARPTGGWNPPDLAPHFSDTRRRTIEFARTADHRLREHIFPHAALGEIDCYQWLLFTVHHGERHARQIEEIKAHREYPAE